MEGLLVPSKTPEAQRLVDRPDMDTRCPASGAKLRFKDLTILNFTRPPAGEEASCYAIDPVTNDALTNAHKLVVLKATGEPLIFPIGACGGAHGSRLCRTAFPAVLHVPAASNEPDPHQHLFCQQRESLCARQSAAGAGDVMKQESYETCVKPDGFWNDVRIRDRCAVPHP